jgi:hypothetical protein
MRSMSAGVRDIEQVLDRLGGVLPERAPVLWESLRAPVAAADLDALRRAVEPFELPGEVVAMLQWADGQEPVGGREVWWPSISCGPLLSAAGTAEQYRFLPSITENWQWSPLWLPIARAGWDQAFVEMTTDRPGVVIDASFHDPGTMVVAPSLAAMLDLVTDMIETGLVPDPPDDQEAFRRHTALIDARADWASWPYDRNIAEDVAAWPPHWRESIGLPADPDAPRLPATPIRDVLSGLTGGADLITIEGYVTDRVLVDVAAVGNSIITLDDGTAATHVLVQPDVPGRYWAAVVGRRIQVDILTGDAADREIASVLDENPERRHRAPVGPCVLAREARVGVQSPR